MRVGGGGPVVVDTGAFGARLMPHGQLLASGYDALVEGRPVIISFITVAELRFGALNARWGPSRRQRLESHIRSARVAWPDQGSYLSIPLVAHDAIFAKVDGLDLLTRL